mgnify:CR=1 FL=1
MPQKSIEKDPIEDSTYSRWKVLLVDDDPDIIAVTQLSLRSFEYKSLKLDIIIANSS